MTLSKSGYGLNTYGYIKQWTPTPLTPPIPHAILDSSHVVIAIRSYPRSARSNCVIPIEEGMACAVGWRWKHSKFCPPEKP